MANPRNEKGKKWERDVVRFMRENGLEVERTKAGRFSDEGDIAGIPNWTLQAKNYRDISRALREGYEKLQEQRGVTGDEFGAVIVKRPQAPVGSAYFVMPLYMAVDVLSLLIKNNDWAMP